MDKKTTNRVRIEMPTHYPFSTTLTIRITDLNYGGHVGNDSFLSLVHEARQQFLLSHGYGELSMAGTGLIMTDAAIEFKKELLFGDEVKISVAAENFTVFGFDLLYKMEIVKDGEVALAGKVKTGMMCFDYEKRKITALPDEVVKKLS